MILLLNWCWFLAKKLTEEVIWAQKWCINWKFSEDCKPTSLPQTEFCFVEAQTSFFYSTLGCEILSSPISVKKVSFGKNFTQPSLFRWQYQKNACGTLFLMDKSPKHENWKYQIWGWTYLGFFLCWFLALFYSKLAKKSQAQLEFCVGEAQMRC